VTTPQREFDVELLLAFVWDCPECGRENFQRGITVSIPEENLPEEYPPEFDQVVITKPRAVTCIYCEHQFKVTTNSDDFEV
jgi:hypothetical protein